MIKVLLILFCSLLIKAQNNGNLPTNFGHQILINWTDGQNPINTKYNIYKLVGSCPGSPPTPPTSLNGFILLNPGKPVLNANNSTTQSLPVPGMSYIDTDIQSGQTYCYFVQPFSNSGYGPPGAMGAFTVPGMYAVTGLNVTGQ